MRSTAPSLAVVLVMLACRSPAPPMLGNTAPPAKGCPLAAAVFGPAQEAYDGTWTLPLGLGSHPLPSSEAALKLGVEMAHELDGAWLPRDRTWLLRGAAAPCAVHVAKVNKMAVCGDDGDCTFKHVLYDAVLAGNCAAPPDDHRDAPDDTDDTDDTRENSDYEPHPPMVVNDGPPACRQSGPVELTDEAIGRADLPEPVRHALKAAKAQPGHMVTLKVTSAARIAAIWQIGSIDLDAVTTEVGNSAENCPMPIWVFVRTPGGVVQLDTEEGVLGLLADERGPAVVLTGTYGRTDNVAFDVARLPPHRPGARSWSSESCIR